jgi:hypothetical protein
MGTYRAHTFQDFKRSCIMLYAKAWECPSAVVTLFIFILLSARINSSTRCIVASVTISTGRHGQASSATLNVLEKISRLCFESFNAQTLPTVNWEHFFMNVLFALSHFARLPKNAQQNAAHGCHFD